MNVWTYLINLQFYEMSNLFSREGLVLIYSTAPLHSSFFTCEEIYEGHTLGRQA
jgi:hypothetical protein